MPSAKQIKARKLFARRSKRGDFRKAITKSKKTKSKSSSKKPKTLKLNPHEGVWTHLKGYKEYKKLGGTKSRREYNKNIDVFQEHTWEIFIFGDLSKYNSREEALEAVKKDLKIDNKELNLIFESIDNVTAYT
jgi:hypothetical protein